MLVLIMVNDDFRIKKILNNFNFFCKSEILCHQTPQYTTIILKWLLSHKVIIPHGNHGQLVG